MTSRKRIMAIFKNEPYDRPSLKLWGYNLGMQPLHPAYAPVIELAGQVTDIFSGAGSPFNIYMGRLAGQYTSSTVTPTASPDWNEVTAVYHTPGGDLTETHYISTAGHPGYQKTHAIKEPEDIEKFLSLPYEPFEFSAEGFFAEEARIGDRGVTMYGLDHAGYAFQRLCGSETLAYFMADCRDAAQEIVSVFSRRLLDHAKLALEAGIRLFCWVGPELLTPPLLGDRDFDDFVYTFDKRLCELIHSYGGYVWVHCHGRVAKLLDRFINMGVDVLNPLEPPKNGDIDLGKAIAAYGNRIGWEGNIEIQEILQSEPERLRELIRSCVRQGKKSGRFILCPSAGFMEYVNPDEKYISNLLLYLKEGAEATAE